MDFTELIKMVAAHRDFLAFLLYASEILAVLLLGVPRLLRELKSTTTLIMGDIQNKLKELVPELSGQFDEYGNFIVDATQDMSNLSEATLEQIKLKNQLKQALLDESAAIQAQSLLDSQSDKIRTNSKGGTLYSESEKIIAKSGFFVVAKRYSGNSKEIKADQLGIEVITGEEFIARYM